MNNIPISTLSHELGKLLKSKSWQISAAESCTGGGFSQAITEVVGSSAWFQGAFVTYSNPAKEEMLGVKHATLEKFSAVSRETAQEMVIGALQRSHANISVSITGIAGPGGGSPQKPIGTVWFGFASQKGECQTVVQHFTGDRQNIRLSSIAFALQHLIGILKLV